MKPLVYRLLPSGETGRIAGLLDELSAYHNRIAKTFTGVYPVIPAAIHLRELAEQVEKGLGRVEIVLDGDTPVGFAAATFEGGYGSIDYLYVREELRGRKIGAKLLRHMLAFLRENEVKFVDLQVVRGNRAKNFYKRHGFLTRSEVMSMTL